MAAKFVYRKIELYKSESLGSGSYGGVCKAKCDGVQCAAKILHPTLFDVGQPGSGSYLQSFKEECRLLSLARHPNVVQYLATHYDPNTQLPVLLMELCDESLTVFLERSPGQLSYYIQINVCHDIALALVYLHSNGLIHRDLTGNNVLMVAGPRAKITDFGMSKLASVNPRMKSLTMCPGNRLYMSPEALDEAKSYTAKLDIFSFGVLVVQILTRQFPDPSDRFRLVSVPNIAEPVRVEIPEAERRKDHLELIPDSHSLKPLALQCLKKESERPSAILLSERLSELKGSTQYTESVHTCSSDAKQLQLQLCDLETKTREQVTELQKLLDVRNRELQEVQYTLLELFEQNRREIATKDQAAQEKEKSLKSELQASELLVSEIQQSLQQKEKKIADLEQVIGTQERKIEQLEQQDTANRDQPPQPPVSGPHTPEEAAQKDAREEMKWGEGKSAPETMVRGAAVVLGNTAYIRPGGSGKVYSYQNTLGEEEWCQLPDNPNSKFGLAAVDSLLTSVGGVKDGVTLTSTLLSLTRGEGETGEWSEVFPPMPTPRRSSACISANRILVVAGGVGTDNALHAVEVMNVDTKQWTTAFPLPQRLWQLSGTVYGDKLYLAGGYADEKPATSVFTCSLSGFLPSTATLSSRLRRSFSRRHTMWREIASLPVSLSTLVSVGGHLLAVGGKDASDTPTSDVYKYDSLSDTWSVAGQMNSSRSWSLAVTLPENRLVVLGGVGELGFNTSSVEILEKN